MPELAKSVLRITKSPNQLAFNDLPPEDTKQRSQILSLGKKKWDSGLLLIIARFKRSHFVFKK